MRDAYTRYYRAMESLATSLMRVFALGLDLPEQFFDEKVNRHISNFSVLHYPPQSEAPRPGQIRAGAHTDYGSLTILSKDAAPGAARCSSALGGGSTSPDVPDTLVVNLGNLMQTGPAGAGARPCTAWSIPHRRRVRKRGGCQWRSSTNRTTTR